MSTTPTSTTPTSTSEAAVVRLAVAQTTTRTDPADGAAFRAAGVEIRELMTQAHDQRADLVLFPEATFCFPDKRALSRTAPELGEADWTRFDWATLTDELELVRQHARSLALWTVIGTQTRGAEARPRTSLLVIDAEGEDHIRYDERRLSRTKDTVMYARGDGPAVFELNGLRFGLASGLEVLFDDIFLAYEDDGVDAVLFATQGPPNPEESDGLATSARAAARHHQLTVGFSAPVSHAPYVPSGVVGPDGRWMASCRARATPDVVTVEVTSRPEGAARAWRRSMVAAD
ncbi:carbon-nitrogen hydrolase family protein [Microlunatus sp. Y2014]|uniref:carbon-nitrogen hydrolase family protein n=1 Tax=Microlunatus sp. Y2014 TaxID=3418488 RepID=UPI003DA71CAC